MRRELNFCSISKLFRTYEKWNYWQYLAIKVAHFQLQQRKCLNMTAGISKKEIGVIKEHNYMDSAFNYSIVSFHRVTTATTQSMLKDMLALLSSS